MKKIGIYSGTFNPIHAGHIAFALQAAEQAGLNRVYFMPERYRQGKADVAHFGHRVAMVRQAINPHRKLGLIESSDISFSVDRTLPKLQNRFLDARLVFLMGSDSLQYLGQWPNASTLLKQSELVIGIRAGDENFVEEWIMRLPTSPKVLYQVNSLAPTVSSTKIREALRRNEETEGLLSSVRRYSDRHWLYISLA